MMAMSSVFQTEYGWSDLVHTLQCPRCSFQTLRPSVFNDHCRQTHPDLTDVFIYSCPTCRASSTDLRLIAEHKFLYHRSEPPNSSRMRQQCDIPPNTSTAEHFPGRAGSICDPPPVASTIEHHTSRAGSISFPSESRKSAREPSPASVQSQPTSSRRQQSSREPSPVVPVVTRSRSSSSSSKARRSLQESSPVAPQPPPRSTATRKRQPSTSTEQLRRSYELSRPAPPPPKKRQSYHPSSTPKLRKSLNSTASPRRSTRQKTPRRQGYSPDISAVNVTPAPGSPAQPVSRRLTEPAKVSRRSSHHVQCSSVTRQHKIRSKITSKLKKKARRTSSMKAIQNMTAAIISITAPDSPVSDVAEVLPERPEKENGCLTAEQQQQLANSPVVRVSNIDSSLLDESEDKIGSIDSPQRDKDKPDNSSVSQTSTPSPSASGVKSLGDEASVKLMNVKPDSKLCSEVRSHMQHLYDRGVRGTSTMISNLREYVIKELRPPGPVGQKDRMYFPSAWTVRRLMRLMGSAENKNDPNKAASTPELFPIKHRHIDVDPPLKSEPETFTVKTEETLRLEMVRCLKCGVRVPFQSDGTRASQDAALIAHLSAKHGIKKREPIVYPPRQQSLSSPRQRAESHVTDLDAGYISSDDSPAKLASSEVRILKEKRVGPLAQPQVKQEWKEVKQQPEDVPDLQLTNVRLRGPKVIVKARHSGVDIDEQLTIPLSNEEGKTEVEERHKGEPRSEEKEMKVDVGCQDRGNSDENVGKEEGITEVRVVEGSRNITKKMKETREDIVETRVIVGMRKNEEKCEKLQEVEEGIVNVSGSFARMDDGGEKVEKAQKVDNELESSSEDADRKMKASLAGEQLEVVDNGDAVEDDSAEDGILNSSSSSVGTGSIMVNMKQAEVSLDGIQGEEMGTSANEAETSAENVAVDERSDDQYGLRKEMSREESGEGSVMAAAEVNSEEENEEEEGGNWQCDLCFAGFEDKEELVLHLQEIHNDF